MEATKFSYYDVLEVDIHSQQHEITHAYERARNTYSGDNPAVYSIFSEEEAREMLRMIEEAYSVLGNKTLRNLYDEKISKGVGKLEDLSFDNLSIESKLTIPEPKKRVPLTKLDYPRNEVMENKYANAADWTGSLLKEVREYKKVSADQLSVVTKVSSFYISAIENMEPSQLPAAVFVRGYVGQIAKYLGLNEKIVCDSYMKNFKQVGK